MITSSGGHSPIGSQLIETLVIALHSDAGVDVKSDRVKFVTVFLCGARIVSEETVRTSELNRGD